MIIQFMKSAKQIDLSGTYADPNQIVVGTPCHFHIDGVMHENEFVKEFCYLAYLDGKLIDYECFKLGGIVYKEDEYFFDYDFDVPSYVPLGSWDVHIILHNTRGQELGCMDAQWTIS